MTKLTRYYYLQCRNKISAYVSETATKTFLAFVEFFLRRFFLTFDCCRGFVFLVEITVQLFILYWNICAHPYSSETFDNIHFINQWAVCAYYEKATLKELASRPRLHFSVVYCAKKNSRCDCAFNLSFLFNKHMHIQTDYYKGLGTLAS